MSGHGQPGHAGPDPRVQAEALARELNGRGLVADVLVAKGHRIHPCVIVAAGQVSDARDYVYAAPDYSRDDRQWWFWWSWLEPIAPVGEVTAAAEEIAGAFARAFTTLAALAVPA
jgi:hypothetical protein